MVFLKARSYNLKARYGFTLIELLISIGILGGLLALGVPAFRNYNKQVAFDGVSQSVATLIADARTLSLAPESNKDSAVVAYGVSFDTPTGVATLNRYSGSTPPAVLSEVKRTTLVNPVVFGEVPVQPILFPIEDAGEPSALPAGGATIVLRNSTLQQQATRTLTVNATTGQVSVQ